MVAVEAIKLENLRSLRDQVLKPVHRYTLSPRINWVDEAGRRVGRPQPSVPADRYPGMFMGLHYVAGLVVVIAANEWAGGYVYRLLMRGGLWALDRPWYVTVLLALGFVWLGVIAGLWMLGELVHVAATRAVQACIRVLDFVDARTPDGTVGVIGFVLLLIGFLLQMYGSYLGGHRVAV